MSETDDLERVEFRKQLKELSFEQLIKLKKKVGAKVYNEGIKSESVKKPTVQYSRINKNRPREMSSKIPVSPLMTAITIPKKVATIDPRFESTSGEYDEKVFKKNYSFMDEIRNKEKEKLQQELNKTTKEDERTKIKFLLQRMTNQEREEKNRRKREEEENEQKEARKKAIKDGKKPHFYKKSEKRLIELVDNYEQLKKSGKLTKHIERKIKKNKHKQRKQYNNI